MPTIEVHHIGDKSIKYAKADINILEDGRWVEVFDPVTTRVKGRHSAATITYIKEY
jgi:hypothetical protein